MGGDFFDYELTALPDDACNDSDFAEVPVYYHVNLTVSHCRDFNSIRVLGSSADAAVPKDANMGSVWP